MNNLSACIIAKNEETNIRRCIESLSPLQCEVIVVDTGSTDNTISIAQKCGAHVYSFPWINDFSAARNFSIKKASNDWIFIIDCDEWITEITGNIWDYLLQDETILGMINRKNLMHADTTFGSYTSLLARVFNRKHYYYQGIIHEQVTPYVTHDLDGILLPITMNHSGYVNEGLSTEQKKNRNITLLTKTLSEDPNQPIQWYHLGHEYYASGEYQRAIDCFEKVLVLNPDKELEYFRHTIQSYCESLLAINEIKKAYLLEQYENLWNSYPDYHYLLGKIYFLDGKLLNSMQCFIKATTLNTPYIEGTNTYLPWFYIGKINELYGEYDAALLFYEKCGDFEPAIDARKQLSERNCL